MRRVNFLGDAQAALKAFPEEARSEAGYQLYRVQNGQDPKDWRPMPSVGPGVREVRVRTSDGSFRGIYLASFPDAIYVLHAFQKKDAAHTETRPGPGDDASSGTDAGDLLTTDTAFETVWDAIEDTSESAAIMRLRSDLTIAIEQTVNGWGLTQARAAKRLGVSQPRLNDLLRGRIGKFSLDALVGLAARAGLRPRLEVGRPGEARVAADPVAEGYQALAAIAASVKNNGQVAPVTVRDRSQSRSFGRSDKS